MKPELFLHANSPWWHYRHRAPSGRLATRILRTTDRDEAQRLVDEIKAKNGSDRTAKGGLTLDELKASLPPLLRFGDINAHLNLPQWVALKIIKAGRVRTRKIIKGRKGHGSVLIDRDQFFAALQNLPDAYQ